MTAGQNVVATGSCYSIGFDFDYKSRQKWVGGVHITYWVQSQAIGAQNDTPMMI